MDQPQSAPADKHDKALIDNVRPADWKDPVPASRYNLVVIGGGTAGLVTAAGAAGLGAKVALIERHLLGGDCLNTGCVPSKGIIRAGRAVHEARSASEFGITCEGAISADFAEAMQRMRRVRAGISAHDSASRLSREFGVDVFLGNGVFRGRDVIEVNGAQLRFKKAAICTGSRPAAPAIPGLEEVGYLTNETVFSLTALPRRMTIIGGGPIGCELAQTFARLGSEVTVIEAADRLLPREDPDAAGIVRMSLARDGVNLVLRAKILKAEKRGGDTVVTLEQNGAAVELAGDEVLVGIGRAPNVEGLGLEAAGVAYDTRQGVKVDGRLRTTNPHVYAAGDVCSPYKFTHTADAQARIVIANALFFGRQTTTSLVIPWCIYTDPEVAHVGIAEHEARSRGIETHTLTVPLSDVDRAQLDGETDGFARVHLTKGSDKILGATIVARHAGEMISELTLAMTAGLGLSAIGRTIHPYPTQAEAIRKLADAYNRTRLTPRIKKILTAWLSWRRH